MEELKEIVTKMYNWSKEQSDNKYYYGMSVACKLILMDIDRKIKGQYAWKHYRKQRRKRKCI